jgi:hypothetical protein
MAVPVNAASTTDASAERRRIAQVIGLLMGTAEQKNGSTGVDRVTVIIPVPPASGSE